MGKPIHEPDDREFRARAVELVRSSGLTKAQVARDLGIHAETRRLGVTQAEMDAGRRDGLTTDEKAELTRLRRAGAVLQEEREILTKAAAFFARASAPRCIATRSSQPRRPRPRSRSPVGCAVCRVRATTLGVGARPRPVPRPLPGGRSASGPSIKQVGAPRGAHASKPSGERSGSGAGAAALPD